MPGRKGIVIWGQHSTDANSKCLVHVISEGEFVNISKLEIFTIFTTISGLWEGPKVAPPGAIGTTEEGFNAETLVSAVLAGTKQNKINNIG